MKWLSTLKGAIVVAVLWILWYAMGLMFETKHAMVGLNVSIGALLIYLSLYVLIKTKPKEEKHD